MVASILLIPVSADAQTQRTVTGTVVDETGEPLIGATVQVSGESIGTSTDMDGRYSLNVPAKAKRLTFSYVGYEKMEVDITSDVINVTMKPGDALLDEVVVIGYGTQKKNDLTGSVSSVSEKDFNQGVISSPEELINGKIAGVQITNNGGSPNGGSTIRIRGGASLNASNDPLIVLDGVPMEKGDGITGSGNFLSMINPNDIESMTILKDASSTAIYGSRASNGVIIINTKKGGGNRIKVSFQTTNSLSHATRHNRMLDRDQFVEEVLATGNLDYINALGEEDMRERLRVMCDLGSGTLEPGTHHVHDVRDGELLREADHEDVLDGKRDAERGRLCMTGVAVPEHRKRDGHGAALVEQPACEQLERHAVGDFGHAEVEHRGLEHGDLIALDLGRLGVLHRQAAVRDDIAVGHFPGHEHPELHGRLKARQKREHEQGGDQDEEAHAVMVLPEQRPRYPGKLIDAKRGVSRSHHRPVLFVRPEGGVPRRRK